MLKFERIIIYLLIFNAFKHLYTAYNNRADKTYSNY